MARKTVDITIDDEDSRDKGKTFRLKELSAEEAEDWLIAFGLAAARSGVILPPNFQEIGLAAIAGIGLQALGGMHLEEARPLLAKMFSCIKIISKATPDGREITKDDIEEVSTRFRLRKEVIDLHTGFFTRAARLKLEREQAEAAAAKSAGQDTSTSLTA